MLGAHHFRFVPYLCCLALLAGANGRGQSPAGQLPKQLASPQPADVKEALRKYEKGLQEEKRGNLEEALNAFGDAAKLAPTNREYLVRRDVVRGRIVRDHVEKAERLAVMGLLENAREELRQAIALDPGDDVAQQRLQQVGEMEAGEIRELPPVLAGEVRVVPQGGVLPFNYRGDTIGAYTEVAKAFGLSAAFDVDLRSRPVKFQFDNLDFETAMKLLGDMTGTFWRPLTSRMFFVAEDSPQKRRDYDQAVVRTFLLPASVTADDMEEVFRVVREIAGVTRSTLDTSSRTITMRDSPEKIAVAEKLLDSIENPRGELILEIEILEVDRDKARTLGITPPESGTVVTVSSQQLALAEQSVQGLISVLTQLFGSPAALAGLSNSQIGSLVGGGQVGLGTLIPPLLAFGGGKTTFFATMPGAAANFSDTLTLVRSGQRILLRAQDGHPASFFVGNRVPITLAEFSSSLSGQFVPGVSQQAFATASFATGKGPRGVAAADFNGDKKPDLAVVNQTDNTVSILLGNGDGTFGAKTDFPTGKTPVAIATGDFNADGKIDLAIVNHADNTVSILLGNGDGTFGPKKDFPTGAGPSAIVTGDFNGDGKTDLAITNQTDNTVSILLGNGDGTFQPKKDFPTGTSPVAVAAADFNGDGHVDLAVANQSANTVSILLGKGDGTFGAKTDFPTGAGPDAVSATDLNGDGFIDLVVANGTDNTISSLLGHGDGTFATQLTFATGNDPDAIIVGDFNIDGRPDVVTANFTDNTISILLGVGDGTFVPHFDIQAGTGPVALTTADFNGDSRPDVAIADQTADTVTVILNNSTFTQAAANAAETPFPGSQYEDVGLKLKATPRIHPDDEVSLKLEFEIRSLIAQNINGIPVISNRTIEQTVRVRQDETSVLAGILDETTTRAISGSPGLADLPISNYLFGKHTEDTQRTELLILVTPRLVRIAPHSARTIYAGTGRLNNSAGVGEQFGPVDSPIQPTPPQRPPNPP
ncbi:MAG: FG-GAP-like repeat-containing protein [Candidatus Acidiferrales bacterium]